MNKEHADFQIMCPVAIISSDFGMRSVFTVSKNDSEIFDNSNNRYIANEINRHKYLNNKKIYKYTRD